jgi:sarcosine oxidase subunit beta
VRAALGRVVTADVLVVGAGVTGLSAAFHLLERDAGKTVVVVDRAGIGAGASGVQPGGVRQQWSTRVNCVLARRSLAFYREAAERLRSRADLTFRPCGYVFVAHAAETLERLRRDTAVQNGLGIPSRLVTPDEAAAIVPDLRAEALLGASWCGEDGYFDRPQAVVEAFAEAARGLGAAIEFGEVTALDRFGESWRARLADGGEIAAEAVVVAAGADTRELVRPLGHDLPIEREDRHLFYSAPLAERLLEPLVVAPDRRFAAKQLADGRVLASDLAAVGEPTEQRERWRRAVRAGIEELLPRLTLVPLPLLVSGIYDVTPDRQAIVGPLERGLVVAAGFSGHGFMVAPEIGTTVAALVAGEPLPKELAELAPTRFAHGKLRPERQVI